MKVKELISGELGKPHAIIGSYAFEWPLSGGEWFWDDYYGGGLFTENSCHLFQALLQLAGPVRRVFAHGMESHPLPGPDVASISLQFHSGTVASILVGAVGAPAMPDYPSIDVRCTNGRVTATGVEHCWRTVKWATKADTAMSSHDYDAEAFANTRITAAMDHFITGIREQKLFTTGIHDGMAALQISLAVNESARRGEPVTLSEFSGDHSYPEGVCE